MFDPSLDPRLVARYLRILGSPQRPPGWEALQQLVSAHLTCIPFENISKLYYLGTMGLRALPTIEQYLDGIEQSHFGGTCYSNNFNFYRLLVSLGYDTKLCAADMHSPDVHMVILVKVEDREYVIDAGYAAPFLLPVPRDLAVDFVLTLGRDRYVLEPQDASGCSRLQFYRDNVLKHGYLVKPAPKKIEDFQRVISDSFRPTATFLNGLLLVRFYAGGSVAVHNLSLIASQGNHSTVRTLRTREELVVEIRNHFSMPREMITEAMKHLGSLIDVWS